MATVIIFLEPNRQPDNLTEIHFFEDDAAALKFSSSLMDVKHFRPHLVKRIDNNHWHRQPNGPLENRVYTPFAFER